MNGKLSFAQRLLNLQIPKQTLIEQPQSIKKEHTVMTPQRNGYSKFKEQYNDLKDILKMLEGDKLQELQRSPLLRPITPTKDNSPFNQKNLKTKSAQLNLQNCQQIKQNLWETKRLNIQRQQYEPKSSKRLHKTEPLIPLSCKEIPKSIELSISTKKGIPNHGNTCYINSIVQCLFHLPHFNDYFADQNYLSQQNGKSKQVVQLYRSLFINIMRNGSQEKPSTLPLKRSVSSICSLFIDWQQEDAHQFMKKLLNTIHQELNRVKNKPKYRQMFKELEGESLEKMASAYWAYEKQRDDSYIYQTFCGQIYNNIRCINCSNESDSFENYLDLSIPITPNAKSLEDLLQDYFEPQKLSDFYLCGKCNKSSKKSTKTVQLWRVPKFLLIHLKRSQLQKKNIDPLTIPQNLTLKPFMNDSNDRTAKFCQYSLCGIVMHQGVLEGGHYWSNVKESGKWYELDDENVKQVNSEEFRRSITKQGSSNAYILFYSSLYS